MINRIFTSSTRALMMLCQWKMILLSLLPSAIALIVWAVVLYFSLQPLIDYLQQFAADNEGVQLASSTFTFFGLLTLKALIVPLIAMWLLLPLMLLSALLFVACIAMPMINKTVSQQYYSQLAKRYGGSWWRTFIFTFFCVIIFIIAWIFTLPLSLLPPLGLIIQPVLLGWLTYRVMAYDALASHASVHERKMILEQHRLPLWGIGIIAGLLGALPGLIWLGGVLSIIFLPILAAVAIWLYVLVFMFSGLWFQLYCLEALHALRQQNTLHS
jgi:hypothetical protein